MSRFSILLIENQISVTAQIVEVIGQNLADYTLTITKNFAEITTEPERPHVILLDVALLSNDVPDQWTILTTAYPDIPIKLLVPQPPLDSTSEVKLMDALRRGANSYYDVSEPGLLSLGRSLATLQQHSQSGQSVNLSNPPSIGDLLVQAISRDTSQLAIQIFDLKGRVKAWSQAAELLFQIKPENAIGHLIDELPLATDNLSECGY